MEGKGVEVTNMGRASSLSTTATPSASTKTSGKSWWQWTHGKSGSVSSSSGDMSALVSSQYGQSSSTHVDTTSHTGLDNSTTTSASVPAWDTMRWEKRTTRTNSTVREDRSFSGSSSSKSSTFSPNFSASSSSMLNTSTSGFTATPRKKLVQSSIRSARDVTIRKRFTSSSSSASGLHDFTLPSSAKDGHTAAIAALDREMHAEIKWTGGPGKRKAVKKEKNAGNRVSSSLQQHSRSGLGGVAHRPLRAWLDGGPQASGASADVDVHMLEEKPTQCLSPTSTASTISSAASVTSSSFYGLADPVTTCARAILVDCYRERQYVQARGLRKRTLEGRTKSEKASDSLLWSYPAELSKSPDGGGFSCGSSSSDDELKEVSCFEDNKSERDSDTKSIPEEERYRQLMLCATEVSSSPEVDLRSPILEEKGLSAELRYQLPLARGTANETDKECTICKTRYNIGDHICTLPCQHFFHYRCVDRWLCSHTSCPLCRWDVTADADTMEFNQKHQLAECSPSDREAFQREMRSSSHSAGFRPVVSEVDQLHQRLATLQLQEEYAEVNGQQAKYLVCPTPQRPQRK